VTLGDGVKLGNEVKLVSGVKLGNEVWLFKALPLVWLPGKWALHPAGRGRVRLGCFTGAYEELEARTEGDWASKTYTLSEVEQVKAALKYFRSIDSILFE
jgi:hypothetical protein